MEGKVLLAYKDTALSLDYVGSLNLISNTHESSKNIIKIEYLQCKLPNNRIIAE